MYLSEIEIYRKLFAVIKKAITETDNIEYETDIYTQIAKVKGMVELTEEMLKEEEK